MTNQGVTSDLPIAVDIVSDAAQWLSLHRDECVGAIIPYVRNRFSLSNIDAIEALKRSHVLRHARAM